MSATKILRAPLAEDARALFPLVFRTSVVDHIAWDGPDSEQEYIARFAAICEKTLRSERHFFTIADPASSRAIGCCDVRPDEQKFLATVGILIGEAHQGKGLGTRAIGELTAYSFDVLGLHKLVAELFVDNWPSRRSFEKNGFVLEGTTRQSALKRGMARDQWLLGLVNGASRFKAATVGD
jgi:[ribosomal protein S5]-alanine N-acetyltransferase